MINGKYVAVCTLVKNAHRYLDEWLQHHLNLGFDRIYVYEDIGSESHRDITDRYDNVILEEYRHYDDSDIRNRQMFLYKWFIENKSDEVLWCLFSDIDEFLCMDGGIDLQEYLKNYEGLYGYKVKWHNYNASNNKYYSDEPVMERFKSVTDYRNDGYNSFVCLNYQYTLFTDIYNYVGIDDCDCMFLRRYHTKSWEEYCEKQYLLDEDGWIDEFFAYNENMLDCKSDLLNLHDTWKRDKRFKPNDNCLYLEYTKQLSNEEALLFLSKAWYCSIYMNKKLYIDRRFLETDSPFMNDVLSLFETYDEYPDSITILHDNLGKKDYVAGNILLQYTDTDISRCDFSFLNKRNMIMYHRVPNKGHDLCLVLLFGDCHDAYEDMGEYMKYFNYYYPNPDILVFGDNEEKYHEVFDGYENVRYYKTCRLFESICIVLNNPYSLILSTDDTISRVTEVACRTCSANSGRFKFMQ